METGVLRSRFDGIKISNYWVLIIISLGWFLGIGIRITYPALLPQIMDTFRVDFTGGGLILSAMWVAYALMQFPGGFLADRIGERNIVIASMGVAAISLVGIVAAPTFGLFLIGTILLGAGTGLFGTTRITILSDTYPNFSSTAISVSQAAGNLGNTVLPVVGGLISVYLSWRVGLGFTIPIFVLVIFGAIFAVPKRTSALLDQDSSRIGSVFDAVLDRDVLLMTGVLVSLMFVYQGATGFIPAYLIESKTIAQETATLLYGMFFVSAILLQFCSGYLADRYGRRQTILAFVSLSLPGFVLLPMATSLLYIVPLVLAISAALAAIPPSHSYAVELLPEAVQGSGYGLLRTGYISIGAIAPPLIGFLADSGRFDMAFPMLGLVAFSVVLLSIVMIFVQDVAD